MSKENAIRILIADDHPVVREGFAAMLEYLPDMTVVATAANGSEALERFRLHRPDVTLMDLRMPEMNGVEAIAAICREFSDARIIVLTTYQGDEDICQGLRAGARGYLLKDASIEDLLTAIRVVYTGKKYVPPDVAIKLTERVSGTELTTREMEVLRLIAAGKSNQDIANALFIVEGTVKAHVTNILSKMGVHDRTQAVTLALRRGILTLE
jgi:DNA-binding NarL/FixJ family response regulator